MISRIKIHNFKRFRNTEIELRNGLNILCGDNDTGKSTLLEAIDLAISGRYRRRSINHSISPNWFNAEAVKEFISQCSKGARPQPPEIRISITISDTADDSFKTSLRIFPKQEYLTLLYEYASNPDAGYIPGEYYTSEHSTPTGKTLPEVIYIDRGDDYGITADSSSFIAPLLGHRLPNDNLALLSRLTAEIERQVGSDDAVSEFDALLKDTEASLPTGSRLSIGASPLSTAGLDRILGLKIDGIPIEESGSGARRSLLAKLALKQQSTASTTSKILLLEQPEKNLSFTSINRFTDYLLASLGESQAIVTTLSSQITNKLGLDSVILLSRHGHASLADLSPETREYFHRLAGFDTLRLILAKKIILVEGPSDELIVQKAWLQRFGHLPEADGVDVMNVGGLSFRRYIEIAELLKLRAAVVADSDGNPQKLLERLHSSQNDSCGIFTPTLKLSADDFSGRIHDAYFNFNTLEPELLKCNGIEVINNVLSTSFASEAELLTYMWRNKVECAMRIFRSPMAIEIPEYISEAINFISK